MEGKIKKSDILLPDGLNALPSDLVTDDIAEDGKIHPLDEQHIKEDIIDNYKAKIENEGIESEEEREKRILQEFAESLGPGQTITQARVDWVRMRVIRQLITSATIAYSKFNYLEAEKLMKGRHHLWFPKNDINEYELRVGNAPSNVERAMQKKSFLKNIALQVDPLNWPKRMIDLFGKLPSIERFMRAFNQHLRTDNADDIIYS